MDTQTIDLKEKSEYSNNIPDKFKFKAMVVMTNRKACVLMKRALDRYLTEMYGDQAKNWSEIVMTYNYNENDSDIMQYMEELKMKYRNNDFNSINTEIQDKFKNLSDPRILIVTDMLITGFDAPQLRVMYLDKPIHSHKLLQAIGRVNRPAPGKEKGLVVDSIGLLSNLQDALNKYNILLSQDNKSAKYELNETLKDEESEENNFKESLDKIKTDLKSLRIDDEDLSIDLDNLKDDIEKQENWISKYEDKIVKIAFYYSLQNLELTQENDLLQQISKLKEVLDLIYSASKIDPFEESESAIINEESLQKMGEISENEIKDKVYSYFLVVSRKIQDDADSDPFYKKVLEMLDKLKEEWVARKQSTKDVLQQLKTIYEQMKIYSENRDKTNNIDKIVYSIKLALAEEYGESCKEISFDRLSAFLNDIKDKIKDKSPKDAEYIIESKKSELEKKLKIDILRNCKQIKISHLDEYIGVN